MNPVRSIAEKKVAEQTAAKQSDIMLKLLLPAVPAEIEDLMKTLAEQIIPSVQATPYYARPSSHWGINE